MRNFREETLQVLYKHGLEWNDVLWAGTENYTVPLDVLYKTMDFIYDNGYGSQEIAHDLIIVGANWWLERHEYDGSEWWEFKEYPAKPMVERYTENLKVYRRYGGTLAQCNGERSY